jgi:hypothetical protein
MAKGKRQEYRLQQRLTYNDQGRIIKIFHQEIPGEQEALESFMNRVGIEFGED